MSDELMNPQRQDELVKCAEECIGLMNVGLDGNKALAKIAEDKLLNDHEVDLVAHAVNNSKQLAHIQASEPEDREKPFPLVDTDEVKAYKAQPQTNAEVYTGDRYGTQEEMADSSAQKQDQPDAIETQDKIEKDAADLDYRRTAAAPDHAAALREGWGLAAQTKVADYNNPNKPFMRANTFGKAADEARTQAFGAQHSCFETINKVAGELRYINAVDFNRLNKIAAVEGIPSAIMDLVYSASDLEKTGYQRQELTKEAGRMYISVRENELLQKCALAHKLLSDAAGARAVESVMRTRKLAEEARGVQQYDFSTQPAKATMDIDPSKIVEELERIPSEGLGFSQEAMEEAGGVTPAEATPIESESQIFSQPARQDMANLDAQAQIQKLMSDEFIGGHEVPEVIEAFNSALSVNPDFGDAELVSYVRQHLATQGAVPFDLQLRASTAHKTDGDK